MRITSVENRNAAYYCAITTLRQHRFKLYLEYGLHRIDVTLRRQYFDVKIGY